MTLRNRAQSNCPIDAEVDHASMSSRRLQVNSYIVTLEQCNLTGRNDYDHVT